MGFTTGFLGGVTLTYSVLYLSLYLHKSNRNVQHTLLSQQSVLLNSVVEPLPPLPDPPVYEVRKDSVVEMMKDRWNAEVEGLVRKAETTDWNEVRERWERRIGNVFSRLRESDTGKAMEEQYKENVERLGSGEDLQRVAEATQKAGNAMAEQVKEGVDRIRSGEDLERISQAARKTSKAMAAQVKENIDRIGTGEDVKRIGEAAQNLRNSSTAKAMKKQYEENVDRLGTGEDVKRVGEAAQKLRNSGTAKAMEEQYRENVEHLGTEDDMNRIAEAAYDSVRQKRLLEL